MIINVCIKPNSTKGPLLKFQSDDSITIYIREIAADGKANKAAINLLSKHFKISKTKIKILRGNASRHKLIEIDGI